MIGTIPDPTLESLVPRRSTARNLVLLAVGALVLVGLWVAPIVVTPVVTPAASGGGNFPVPGGVVASTDLQPRSLAPVTVVAVAPAPGARVADAWVVRDPIGAPTGLDLEAVPAEAAIPGLAAGQAPDGRYDRLPARVENGEHVTLVIHWEVDDCADLHEGYEPTLVVRPSVGPRYDVTLPAIAGPEFDALTLEDSVTCS